MKQQESTLFDLKASEEGLRGFGFICRTYEDKLKFLCEKLREILVVELKKLATVLVNLLNQFFSQQYRYNKIKIVNLN
jgi:uncharacterized membrane-anchored protein